MALCEVIYTYDFPQKGSADDYAQNYWNLLLGHISFKLNDFFELGEEDVWVGSHKGWDGSQKAHHVGYEVRADFKVIRHCINYNVAMCQ